MHYMGAQLRLSSASVVCSDSLLYDECTAETDQTVLMCCFFLFDLILYVPVNNFSVMLGRVFLG